MLRNKVKVIDPDPAIELDFRSSLAAHVCTLHSRWALEVGGNEPKARGLWST